MSFLSPKSPQVASGGYRNKIALKPGHSLMDWVRLKSKMIPPRPMRITADELAKHNKLGDVWTAINGMVYDITHYVDYHPGGADELMKGAGIDSTDLFNEIHRWVNFQNMLKECLVGYLVAPPKTSLQVPGATTSTGFKVPPVRNKIQQLPTVSFSSDKYQTPSCYTFIIYTKLSTQIKFRKGFYYGDVKDDSIILVVQCYDKSYFLSFKYHGPSKKTVIRQFPLKLEVQVHKINEENWDAEGTHNKESQSTHQITKLLEFQAKLTKSHRYNHDTKLLEFEYLGDVEAIPPIGCHIFVKNPDSTSIISQKPYTVFAVPSKKEIRLLVKEYPQGTLSRYLCNLSEGALIRALGFDHHFNLNIILRHQDVVMLAAGTGITPFHRIIDEVLQNDLFSGIIFHLLYYNKTRADILMRDKLDALTKDGRFGVTHIFSQEAQDPGKLTGYISPEHLNHLKTTSLFLTCGPSGFMKAAREALQSLDVPQSNIVEFKG